MVASAVNLRFGNISFGEWKKTLKDYVRLRQVILCCGKCLKLENPVWGISVIKHVCVLSKMQADMARQQMEFDQWMRKMDEQASQERQKESGQVAMAIVQSMQAFQAKLFQELFKSDDTKN